MSIGIGSRSKLQFAEESSYGTFNSGATPYNLAITNESIQKTINTITSDLIRSDRRIPSIRGGNIAAGGDINTELQPNAHVLFWKHGLADAATTSGASATAFSATTYVQAGDMIENAAGNKIYLVVQPGTTGASEPTHSTVGQTSENGSATMMYIGTSETGWYKHVLVGNTTFPTGGLCFEKIIERGTTDAYFRYVGGRVNTIGITVPQEGIVTANFGLLFQNEDSSDEVVGNGFNDPGTSVNDEVFAGYDVSVDLSLKGGASFSLIPYVSSVSFNMTNEFDENIYAIPSRFRRELVDGRRMITGSMELFFESVDEFNYFTNETVVDLKLGFVNVNGSMLIQLPEVKFTGGNPTPQITGTGAIGTSIDFQAFYTGTGSITEDIQVTMFNTTSTI